MKKLSKARKVVSHAKMVDSESYTPGSKEESKRGQAVGADSGDYHNHNHHGVQTVEFKLKEVWGAPDDLGHTVKSGKKQERSSKL